MIVTKMITPQLSSDIDLDDTLDVVDTSRSVVPIGFREYLKTQYRQFWNALKQKYEDYVEGRPRMLNTARNTDETFPTMSKEIDLDDELDVVDDTPMSNTMDLDDELDVVDDTPGPTMRGQIERDDTIDLDDTLNNLRL